MSHTHYFGPTSLSFQDLSCKIPDSVSASKFPSRMPDPAPLDASLTFEKALEELEALVARMEDGRLPLEESLAAYQRGAELVKFCEGKLTDAQARVAVLEGDQLRDLPPPK